MKVILSVLFVLFVYSIACHKDTCDDCLAKTPKLIEVRSDYFAEDLEQFETILSNNCEYLYRDDLLTKCQKQVSSYLFGLLLQSTSDHSFMYTNLQACAITGSCLVECCASDLPEQVHISLTNDPSEMVVMWVTSNLLSDPNVIYYQEGFSTKMTVDAVQSTYTDGGWVGNIYTAVLTSLEPLSTYYYQVSGEHLGNSFYSKSYSFVSAPSTDSSNAAYVRRNLADIGDIELFNAPVEKSKHHAKYAVGSPVIAIFGDMDTSSNSNETAQSIAQLVQNHTVSLVLHDGDISYADEDESIWDVYFNMIEPFASVVPYMTTTGNHESYYNFSAYYNRLTMPVASSNSTNKQYYSFNYQNIHFVSWSVEENNGTDLFPGKPQYDWLENDLMVANQNRDKQPWIVLYGHRPLYCSSDSKDCTEYALYYRYLIEELINIYHVDVVIQAHKHNYERTFPVYKGELMTESYVDPPAPVYFVVGTGGKEKNSDFQDPCPDWSAAQGDKFGYVLMTAPDAYTLETVYISKSFNPYDNVTITRTSTFW